MNDRLMRASDALLGASKTFAEISLEAADLTLQIIHEYSKSKKMSDLANSNTRLEYACREVGGYVISLPGGITFNNIGTVMSHNMIKRYECLNYAAALALEATDNYPYKKIGSETYVRESDSLAVITKSDSITIQPKNSSNYVVTRYSSLSDRDWNLNNNQWIVIPEADYQPQDQKFRLSYVGRDNFSYSSYDSNDQPEFLPIPMSSASYEAIDKYEFEKAFNYLDKAANEISQLSYDDLVFQGSEITEALQTSYRRAQTYNLSSYQPNKSLLSIILDKLPK